MDNTKEVLYPFRLNMFERIYEKPNQYTQISSNGKSIQIDIKYLEEKLNINNFVELSKLMHIFCDSISKIK